MWIEVFRTGTQTDSRGNESDYTAERLDSIAELYNSKVAEDDSFMAPVVKGHPASDAPALGWVERLARRGEFLVAKLKGIDPELAGEVQNGNFASVSISLYPDNMLRHVGFLGAAAPAVRGLRRPNLRSGSEYAEYEHQPDCGPAAPTTASTTAETASTVPPTAVTAAAALGEGDREENPIQTQETTSKHDTGRLLTVQIRELGQKLADSDEKIRQLEQANQTKRQEILDLEKTIKNMEQETRMQEFRNFAESIKSEDGSRRYTPAQIDDICRLLEMLNYSGSSEALGASSDFSESEPDGTALLKRFVSSAPIHLPMGEFSAPPPRVFARSQQPANSSDTRWAVHSRAQDLLRTSAATSYEEAAERALREMY